MSYYDDEIAGKEDLIPHPIRRSSSGRTTDFGSVNRGSNPCRLTIKHKWPFEDFLYVADCLEDHDEYDWGCSEWEHWKD